ncbi:hypothetical protein FRC14_006443 [Serendipita sp. 396]|nr:hypothetical protein FRC14_006443 [Serendipita sp. 396]KAG8787872.1 hypothetical protein FRC15_007379 [Serendipita sp. 397]KAG8818035.1 hypothetical protein FRC19_010923 [Serendipita sp. 401]KAG8871817.1 hypothetical protein FRC20_010155 [Serendipita sp. 405]KAG9045375.1 hypothetical protein FS842_001204 [Serendipita sp. 407]
MADTLEALDLTHVLYDPASNLGLALALVTLSPILLMACYGALSVVTRDLLIINMWIGQFGCEGFNYVLKHVIKEERPATLHPSGGGYGFPSSHSQFMGYFAAFMVLHLHLHHRFATTGIVLLDTLFALAVRGAIVSLALAVCYSRYYLGYHTVPQILWGLGIGIALGCGYYVTTEYIPRAYPNSLPGKFRRFLLASPPFVWLRIMDGWAVWSDGGHGDAYSRWRQRWDQKARKSL